jgi:hypothetical protein
MWLVIAVATFDLVKKAIYQIGTFNTLGNLNATTYVHSPRPHSKNGVGNV